MNKLSLIKTVFVLAPLSFNTVYAKLPNMAFGMDSNKGIKRVHKNLLSNRLKVNAKGTILESINAGAAPENWYNLDPTLDGVEGVSADRVYQELGTSSPAEDIIVAVIDSGVDVNHEDLQGKIWTNEGEIADNGIDDDGNGYIDDVFGWNFIGNAKGMATIKADASSENGYTLVKGDPALQVGADTLEVTREYVRLLKRQDDLTQAGLDLSAEEKVLLAKVTKEVTEERAKALRAIADLSNSKNEYVKQEKILRGAGVSEMTVDAIEALQTTDPKVIAAKLAMIQFLDEGFDIGRVQSGLDYYGTMADYYYNPKFDTRTSIVLDDYSNQTETNYGNNDVIGPDAFHGTHVAGIIAAKRDNQLGINGVAKNVKIMAIRTIPNGDERDKDVANSIIYAVDNGARIINMSFGKDYSPYKTVVDEAIKYAETKGVLLVHAAGNSNQNNDTASNFPNRKLNNQITTNNWLEIGASSFEKSMSLAAGFSNFGAASVDFFAPGVNIHSTTPDDEYKDASGTSMASPVTAGVAALVLSYKPELTASELRRILIGTTNRYPMLYVYKKGQGKVLFADLSVYGGIPNAYAAVKLIKDAEVDSDIDELASEKPRSGKKLVAWLKKIFKSKKNLL